MFKKFFCRETEFEQFMLAFATNIEKTADEFRRGITAFDPDKVGEWVAKMKEMEKGCDTVTHETMNWLGRTFIVNYDREDIHQLASDLDDIVDFMDAAAMRISLYNVDKVLPDIVLLTDKLHLACYETAKAVRAISGEKIDRGVLDICKNIKNYEEEGDKIYHGLLGKLFRDGNDPLHVLKFKEIVEEIERSLDKCNQSAMNVESIIFKYS
jgi:predicted phosphate transport protein (TIGR00153 family)